MKTSITLLPLIYLRLRKTIKHMRCYRCVRFALIRCIHNSYIDNPVLQKLIFKTYNQYLYKNITINFILLLFYTFVFLVLECPYLYLFLALFAKIKATFL
jgi:hypothetical protein